MFSQRKKENVRAGRKKGFTLIEMLIAVLVFSLSLASLMLVSSRSLKSSRYSKEHVIANYLALEGVELVHNMRDQALLSRSLSGGDWELVFTGDGVFDDDGCFNGDGACNFYFDNGEPQLGKCGVCNVFFKEGRYIQTHGDYQDGEKTPYRRKIYIKPSAQNENEVFVLVEVYWDGGGVSYGENLYLYQ